MNKILTSRFFRLALSKRLSIAISVSIALAAILTAVPFFPQAKSNPDPAVRATVQLAGLKAPVEIVRDRYGIPHIYAESQEDAFFALGYFHATDRLFQMELFRRRASGTMAEIFGKNLLEDDIFVRQIGIRRAAEAVWRSERLPTFIKQHITAYCETSAPNQRRNTYCGLQRTRYNARGVDTG